VMTLRRPGDRIPNPCPSCGGSLVIEGESGTATFDTDNLSTDARVYRTLCEKCAGRFDYNTRNGRLIPVKGGA
jgi:hypothetical protein